MSSLLFVEDSQPFPRVLLAVLKKKAEFPVDRAFSPVHAANKLKERRYNRVLVCGRESGNGMVQDAAMQAGAAYFSVDISPAKPAKDRTGYLKEATLFLEDVHHAAEFGLTGFRNEQDLFAAAAEHVLSFIRDHPDAEEADSASLRLYEILEGSRMGVAVISGRRLERVNRYLAGILGYGPEEAAILEFPDLFSNGDEYREFSRAMTQNRNGAGWHCSTRNLAGRGGTAIPCTVMVRRLDDFNPLKGHLLIVEPAGDSGQVSREFQQAVTSAGAKPLGEILAGVPGIILAADTEGTISHANAEALRTFGYSPGELDGKNLVGTIVAEGSRYARQTIAMINDPAFCRDGYAIHAFENTRKNGTKIWIAWKVLALRDSCGRITGMLLLGEDITERSAGTPDRIRADPWKYQVLAGTRVQEEVFDAVFHLCVELSRDGWEGHAVGTSLVIGDTRAVMEHSRACTINSFEGQPDEKRRVTSPENGEVIKGLAQMDGAFVIREDGYIEASGRHFIIDNLVLKIPPGYGTRHSSVAGITQMTGAIGFVVSSTGGKISVMKNGVICKSFTV